MGMLSQRLLRPLCTQDIDCAPGSVLYRVSEWLGSWGNEALMGCCLSPTRLQATQVWTKAPAQPMYTPSPHWRPKEKLVTGKEGHWDKGPRNEPRLRVKPKTASRSGEAEGSSPNLLPGMHVLHHFGIPTSLELWNRKNGASVKKNIYINR